jgi:2-dehydro-3-deoxyphosphogluconate aldolase/(4S)-4-hydroxy-2-oxoglutarate aldolase
MSKIHRCDVLRLIERQGVIPIFFSSDIEVAKNIVEACYNGGSRIIEFTNRDDLAYNIFTELSRYIKEGFPDLLYGAGSIVDAPTAALYISAGAKFIVGPTFNPEIARLCNRRKILYIPGCGTLNEISLAEEYGVDIVKIFPAESVAGPGFIDAVRMACPWMKIMPAGKVGIDRETVMEWFKSGAACLAIGSRLISKELIRNKEYSKISERVSNLLKYVKECQKIFS